MRHGPRHGFHFLQWPRGAVGLRIAGLYATVEGEAAAFSMEGYSLATGGIRVQVPENERDDARALIESDEP